MVVAPSILAADFLNLQSTFDWLNKSFAEWIHVDVMDGHFVPNLALGFPVCEAIASLTQKPLDIHLMVLKPDNYIDKFAALNPKSITVHYEACIHLHKVLQHIRQLGIKAGVALNPHTPVWVLESILSSIDYICVMSVNPGFGGQTFIESTYQKIKQLKKLIKNKNILIEIDGGVNLDNASILKQFGADILVAGSSVFKAENPSQVIQELKNC